MDEGARLAICIHTPWMNNAMLPMCHYPDEGHIGIYDWMTYASVEHLQPPTWAIMQVWQLLQCMSDSGGVAQMG